MTRPSIWARPSTEVARFAGDATAVAAGRDQAAARALVDDPNLAPITKTFAEQRRVAGGLSTKSIGLSLD